MPVLPFGEYRPDVSDYQGQFTRNILNVVPQGDGYGPWPSFSAFSSALAAACRGVFYARKADGSIVVFAGTATKLYQLNNTDFTWTDVSKSAGTYTTIPNADQWQFAQFNNFVIAVQINTAPQVFDPTSSTEFADLGGSPPQARYVAVVNQFLVLSGLGSSTPYRIQWSGLNATTTWTSGTNQSDYQDLPDGGIVRGVAGGESGTIFQDGTIRRMTYAPGAPYVFQIERVTDNKGIFAPLSMVRTDERVFACLSDGFHMIAPGGYPLPIGNERVDRTFFADIDQSNLQLCIGASDPTASRVYWAYKSRAGVAGQFDKIIGYDWTLDRWFRLSVSGEYLATLSKPGLTLEGLDSISASIDALTFSLDDVSTNPLAQMACVNTDHKLGFFTGTAMEATLETTERGGDGRRMRVKSFRPVTDAATVYGSVSLRETQHATATYSEEQSLNDYGLFHPNVSTRYARGKLRIPAETSWTYAVGVEPEIRLEGKR